MERSQATVPTACPPGAGLRELRLPDPPGSGSPSPARPLRGGARRVRWLVASLLLLGAVLRMPGLVVFPFEQDELYTVIEATDLFDTRLEPGIEARPLYFLLQHTVIEAIPHTPVMLRLPALVFGLLGMWLTWRLGLALFGTTGGLVALLLVVLSPWHLHVSTMARYWSLVYLLAAAFFLLLARASETDRRTDHLAALGVLVLGSLTHPSFLFPAAGASLGSLLVTRGGGFGVRWPSRREWACLWGPFLLLLAGGMLALRLAGNESALRNWSGRGWEASLRLVPAMVEWATPLVIAAGALGAVGLALWARSAVRRRWGMMALLGCLSAVGLLAAASLTTDVYADYATAMLPLVFVSAGGLAQLGADRISSPPQAVGAVAMVLLTAGTLPSTVSHLSDGTRFDLRPAFRHIRAAAPGLPVLAWPKIVQEKYAPDLDGRLLPMSTAHLDSLLAGERDLWVVASLQRYGMVPDDSGRVYAWIQVNCVLEMVHERPRFDYRRYRVEVHRCRAGQGAPAASPREPQPSREVT